MNRDVEAEVKALREMGERSRRDRAFKEAYDNLLFPYELCDICGHQNQNCHCGHETGVIFCCGFETGELYE